MPIEIKSESEGKEKEPINYDKIRNIVTDVVNSIVPNSFMPILDDIKLSIDVLRDMIATLQTSVDSSAEGINPQTITDLSDQIETLTSLTVAIGTTIGTTIEGEPLPEEVEVNTTNIEQIDIIISDLTSIKATLSTVDRNVEDIKGVL